MLAIRHRVSLGFRRGSSVHHVGDRRFLRLHGRRGRGVVRLRSVLRRKVLFIARRRPIVLLGNRLMTLLWLLLLLVRVLLHECVLGDERVHEGVDGF